MTSGGKGGGDETVTLWIVDSEGAEVDNPELFNSLHNSLNRDQYIRDNAELVLRAPREVMGLDVAAIQLILYAGFEFANLALAISQWRAGRQEATGKHELVGSIAVMANGQKTVLGPEDMYDSDDRRPALRRAFSGAPDPTKSSVVLIGLSDYANLPRLPGVQRNLSQLRRVLGDPEVWGVPSSRIFEVDYPDSAEAIFDEIAAAAKYATDTLLVYFAGHGLFRDQEFRIALPEATENSNEHTVRWQQVANKIREAGCPRTVVWLDCCHAGRAMTSDRKGPYLLAAVQKSDRAMAQVGSGCTAFTHEVIEALSRGIAMDPPEEYLSLNDLHQQVRDELRRKRLPQPTRHDPGGIGRRPHFYNKSKTRPRRVWNPFSSMLNRDNSRRLPMPARPRVAAAIVAVLAGLAIAWFIPGPDVAGLDLGKRCSALAPGGAQTFAVAGDSCAQVIELDDACDFSYQTTGMNARFLSEDPRSAQCFNSLSSTASRGGIKDMTGYCGSHTGVPGVVATSNNPLYRGKWICQSDVNTDVECNYQYNRSDLSSREDENENLICYQTHWF